MKTPTFPLLVALGIAVHIEAQEALSSKTTLRTKPLIEDLERPVLPAPKRLVVESARITYGGVVGDAAKARKRTTIPGRSKQSKLKKYPDNIYKDPATGKIKGFVLFAIRF